MIQNPIIPGFYPDPSICRADDNYYIVNSSFSYFPGVPIFHSKDLAHWEQIGHVLDRKSQLPLTYEMISGGIFAPTIRYHQGTFYVIATNMTAGCINFVVTAKDPEGPWSEMHVIEGADGIDPSLFWDEEGTCYYTGTTRFAEESGSKQGIWCSQIDVEEFKLIGERHIIGAGAQVNSAAPEGPHIYKRQGYYYLLIAEGGTEHYHAITISRSKHIFGPYENYQGNPILTHRHLGKEYPICNVGHGDMAELQDGSWYMVMLGSRLVDGYHKIMGRETFIAPVTWEDGWPIVSKGTGKVEQTYQSPNMGEYVMNMTETSQTIYWKKDDFEEGKLGFEWNYLGTPYEDFVKVEDSCLKLQLLKKSTVPWEFNNTSGAVFTRIQMIGRTKESVSFIGRRQQHMKFEAVTKVSFYPEDAESAGIILLQNDANQIRLEAKLNDAFKPMIQCVKTVSTINEEMIQHFEETIVGTCAWPEKADKYYLKIVGNGARYSFYLGISETEWKEAAIDVEGGFLGSETAGGFVGTYIGMFASGGGTTKDKYAAFDYFVYKGVE